MKEKPKAALKEKNSVAPEVVSMAATWADTMAGLMAAPWDPTMAAATADRSVDQTDAQTAASWDPHWADPRAALTVATKDDTMVHLMAGP